MEKVFDFLLFFSFLFKWFSAKTLQHAKENENVRSVVGSEAGQDCEGHEGEGSVQVLTCSCCGIVRWLSYSALLSLFNVFSLPFLRILCQSQKALDAEAEQQSAGRILLLRL